MVSVDLSIVPAIVIFLSLVVLLNYLFFRPLVRIQKERARRTTGVLSEAQRSLEHQDRLIARYEEAVKAARFEGYKLLEEARARAGQIRAQAIDHAREEAGRFLVESRAAIEVQVRDARLQLTREAQEISRSLAQAILQRSV